MAFDDIYELVDESELAGQAVFNVYFYKNDLPASGWNAQDLIDSYVGQVLPLVCQIQTPDVLHYRVRARNLFNPTDDADTLISEAGTNSSGDYNSNFDAVAFALDQDNGAVKNGAKRYGSIPDGDILENIIVGAGYITDLLALGSILSGTLDVGVVATWLPVIVKRILESPGVYRLPENSGETVYGTITDAVYNPVVSSQVSRKIGVGI